MYLTQATSGELLRCLEISGGRQNPIPAEISSVDDNNTTCVLGLAGEIDIRCAAELKNILLLALKLGKNLQLNLSAASEMDITAVQLLWAAAAEAEREGREFVLDVPLPQAILACISMSCLNLRTMPT